MEELLKQCLLDLTQQNWPEPLNRDKKGVEHIMDNWTVEYFTKYLALKLTEKGVQLPTPSTH